MDNTKIRNITKYLIALIFFVISTVLVINVIKLDVLPTKYLSLLIAVIAILNLLADVCLIVKKIWTKFIAVPIYILLLVISILGIKYISSTNDFLKDGFNNYTKEVSTYYVVVKNDSDISSVSDLTNKDITYFSFYQHKDNILEELNNNIKDAKLSESDDLYTSFQNLLDNKSTSLVIEAGYIAVLEENFEDVEGKIKKIYTFEVETTIDNEEETPTNEEPSDPSSPEENQPTEQTKPEKINKGESINIFISGSDSRTSTINNNSRSDVNMILSINPNTKTILLTSIPRDYYVQIYGTTGLKDKLSYTGLYGLNNTTKVVEKLFDIDIDYSIKIGFNGVIKLVDLVGGINIYSDTTFKSSHLPGWTVQKGNNYMDGEKALAYARERYAYKSGDRHRVLNQQQVLEATLKKVMTNKSLLLKYDEVLDSLKSFYVTNIPRSLISKYIKMQLSDMSSWNFQTQSIDGTGKTTSTYTFPKGKMYVMVEDKNSIAKARAKIKSVLEA